MKPMFMIAASRTGTRKTEDADATNATEELARKAVEFIEQKAPDVLADTLRAELIGAVAAVVALTVVVAGSIWALRKAIRLGSDSDAGLPLALVGAAALVMAAAGITYAAIHAAQVVWSPRAVLFEEALCIVGGKCR